MDERAEDAEPGTTPDPPSDMSEHTPDVTTMDTPGVTLPSSDGADSMIGRQAHGTTDSLPSPPADEPDAPSGGQSPQDGDRPAKTPGRVTSLLGVLLLALMVALALLPTIVHHASPQDPLDLAMLSVGCLTAMMVLVTPTVLLGLRSASKPRGTAGRGRGLAVVIMATLVPVVTFAVTLCHAYGKAHDLMHSGLVLQSVRPDGTTALVSPVGTRALSPGEEQVLGALCLLPDIIIEDGDEVAVESEAGEVTVGDREVSLDDDATSAIARGIEEAKSRGYKVSLGADGRLHGTDEDGNDVTVSLTEDGINIRTDTDMTFRELIGLGEGYLSSKRGF